MRRFIDIGANLTDPQFRGVYRGARKHADDFSAVLARAREQGVVRMLVTGSSLDESAAALEQARAHADLLSSTVGVHPCQAAEVPAAAPARDEYWARLADLAARGRREGVVKAFGEIGLDYDRLHYAPADTQRGVFAEQLELATRLGLPLFLHSRNAAADFLRMVRPYAHLGGVVHSFTGSAEELADLLALGLYIGVNGCSLKSAENLDVVRRIPLQRLLLETDAPWCEIRRTHASFAHTRALPYEYAKRPEKWQPGQMVRGRCEPCAMPNVAQAVAAALDLPEQLVIDAAYENAQALFKFATPGEVNDAAGGAPGAAPNSAE